MKTMTPDTKPQPQKVSGEDRSNSNHGRYITSEDLLQGEKELFIEHQGSVYRLQATRQGKLILVK
jgi:hemin uptake protein HemP